MHVKNREIKGPDSEKIFSGNYYAQRKVCLGGSSIRNNTSARPRISMSAHSQPSKGNLGIYLGEKRKVFSRIRGHAVKVRTNKWFEFPNGIREIAAVVFSNSTMGDATTVVAFLVFSKHWLSVEFRCALCIDAQRPRFILNERSEQFYSLKQ